MFIQKKWGNFKVIYIAIANSMLGDAFHNLNCSIKLNTDYDKAREYYWKAIEYGNHTVIEKDSLFLLQSAIEKKKEEKEEEERKKEREEREKQNL